MNVNPKIIEAAVLNKNISVDSVCAYVQNVADLNVKGVCFPSSVVNIPKLRNFIENSSYVNSIDIIGVVGYPNGDTSIASKLAEISDFCGFASILDVVINPLYIHSGMWDCVRGEMIELFLSTNAEVRWIIETPTLSDEHIIHVCDIVVSTGGHIKTASGVKGSTNVKHVELLRKRLNEANRGTLLKVSGGISSNQIASAMLDAGADLLGCSTPSLIL